MNEALRPVDDRSGCERRSHFGSGSARILVVEDDGAFRRLLGAKLKAEGFIVDHVGKGDEAEDKIVRWSPDLVILDWMLPGLSGLEICRRLREREATRGLPLIMLSARGDESDRVRGLNMGADDYVVKPASFLELMARVHALLRRVRPNPADCALLAGDVELDRRKRRIRRAGREVRLGPTEFRLLAYFMERPGLVFSRPQLLDAMWGLSADIDERTVDVYVGRLRRALSTESERDPIRTVRGAGYAFDETFANAPGPAEKAGAEFAFRR